MEEIRKQDQSLMVGVGGWAYLPIKHGNKLEICSKIYDFVEVNSTFYTLPDIDRVKKWRKTVGENFEFTIRANRELTHVEKLKPTQKTFKIYEKMAVISDELRASILHFQFPPSLVMTSALIKDWRGFFGSVHSNRQSRGSKFAIETRNADANTSELQKLVQDYDLIPTSDASKEGELHASINSGIVYSRVFGHGEHTKWSFDSQELKEMKEKVSETKARKRYVTFHNLTMYEDASRMKTVVRTGKDESQPRNVPLGLESLRRVIATGRIKYPTTKQSLIDEYGWRTFDKDPEERTHVIQELKKLDEGKTFNSVEGVIRALA